jgi:hypothetical protein
MEIALVFVEGTAAELASAFSAEAVENSLARAFVEVFFQNADELGIANPRRFDLPLQ